MTRRSIAWPSHFEGSIAPSPRGDSGHDGPHGEAAQDRRYTPSSLHLADGPATAHGRSLSTSDRRESATKGTSR
jgi:hypothetical protein